MDGIEEIPHFLGVGIIRRTKRSAHWAGEHSPEHLRKCRPFVAERTSIYVIGVYQFFHEILTKTHDFYLCGNLLFCVPSFLYGRHLLGIVECPAIVTYIPSGILSWMSRSPLMRIPSCPPHSGHFCPGLSEPHEFLIFFIVLPVNRCFELCVFCPFVIPVPSE